MNDLIVNNLPIKSASNLPDKSRIFTLEFNFNKLDRIIKLNGKDDYLDLYLKDDADFILNLFKNGYLKFEYYNIIKNKYIFNRYFSVKKGVYRYYSVKSLKGRINSGRTLKKEIILSLYKKLRKIYNNKLCPKHIHKIIYGEPSDKGIVKLIENDYVIYDSIKENLLVIDEIKTIEREDYKKLKKSKEVSDIVGFKLIQEIIILMDNKLNQKVLNRFPYFLLFIDIRFKKFIKKKSYGLFEIKESIISFYESIKRNNEILKSMNNKQLEFIENFFNYLMKIFSKEVVDENEYEKRYDDYIKNLLNTPTEILEKQLGLK